MDSYAERREPFQERLSLAAERIGEIADGGEHVRFADYFRFCADFVRKMLTLADQIADGWLMRATLEARSAQSAAVCGRDGGGVCGQLCEPGVCGKCDGRRFWAAVCRALYRASADDCVCL